VKLSVFGSTTQSAELAARNGDARLRLFHYDASDQGRSVSAPTGRGQLVSDGELRWGATAALAGLTQWLVEGRGQVSAQWSGGSNRVPGHRVSFIWPDTDISCACQLRPRNGDTRWHFASIRQKQKLHIFSDKITLADEWYNTAALY